MSLLFVLWLSVMLIACAIFLVRAREFLTVTVLLCIMSGFLLAL